MMAAVPAEVRPSPWVEMLRRPDSPVVPASGTTGVVIHLRCATPLSGKNAPLLVLDGRLLSHDELHALNLDPSTIDRLEVMKGPPAVERYGEAARNGVLLITLKHDDR